MGSSRDQLGEFRVRPASNRDGQAVRALVFGVLRCRRRLAHRREGDGANHDGDAGEGVRAEVRRVGKLCGMKWELVPLVVASSMIVGCTRLQDLRRFFLLRCPADGPVAETQLDIQLEPVDIDSYNHRLRAAADGFPMQELIRVGRGDATFPIFHVGPIGASPTHRVLVVAGIHGNEIAASLAAPQLLEDRRADPEAYEACELHLLAPANPVGLMHESRYNAQGCDINRDFGTFRTPEALVIREIFDRVSPTLIVAFHEGPQDGFYVIGTTRAPGALPRAVAQAVHSAGIALSTRSFLGLQLRDPGYEHEGSLTSLLKRLIRLHSLGAYAQAHEVGTLTTESPWSSRNLAARIRAHVVAVRAVCAALRPPPDELTYGAVERAR